MSWVGASLIAVVIGVLGVAATNVLKGGTWLSMETFAIASTAFYLGALAFIAPLSIAAVSIIRMTRIRRPWADTVGGAAAAIAGVFAAGAVGDLIAYGHVVSGVSVLVPFALISGLIAGPIYWWLAGKPRPPYSPAEAMSG